MARIAAIISITLASITNTATPAIAESGMRAGYGPCLAYAASPAEATIIRRESRGWPRAKNRRSTAFGCGQLLAATRARFASRCSTHATTVDPAAQLCLMRAYVHERYGTSAAALAHHNRHHWF